MWIPAGRILPRGIAFHSISPFHRLPSVALSFQLPTTCRLPGNCTVGRYTPTVAEYRIYLNPTSPSLLSSLHLPSYFASPYLVMPAKASSKTAPKSQKGRASSTASTPQKAPSATYVLLLNETLRISDISHHWQSQRSWQGWTYTQDQRDGCIFG